MAKQNSVTIDRDYPTWIVPDNPVWSLPTDSADVHFETELSRGPWASVRRIRALAIEHVPGDVHTHIYFKVTKSQGAMYGTRYETGQVSTSAVLLGEHTIETAAIELGITADCILSVSIWPREPSSRAILHGVRTLHNLHESGYCHTGQVSIGGRKIRAFTSDELMQRPDGRLVKVAVLHVCRS